MTPEDRFIEATANTARQRDEWRARAEKAERTRDELADALKWERVAFEDRRIRLEVAERERDELRRKLDDLAERHKALEGVAAAQREELNAVKMGRDAALSATTDDSALREFGMRVVAAVDGENPMEPFSPDRRAAIVDAVLKGVE